MKKLFNKLFIIILIVIGILFYLYVNDFYKADSSVYDIKSNVKIKQASLGYLFDGEGINDLVIFYPGAKVEEMAYAPLMIKLAENGIDTYIVKMPFKLAILGKNRALEVIDKEKYDNYFMMGHSLGGAMASDFTSTGKGNIKGLILLASYSMKKIPDGIPVLSIYGSLDGVININNYNKYKSNISSNLEEHVIEGANHAGYAYYGKQKNDNDATIKNSEQQNITANYIINFIRGKLNEKN